MKRHLDYAEDLLAAEFELRQAQDAGAMRRWRAMEEAAERSAARAGAVAHWAKGQEGAPEAPAKRRPRLDLWIAFLLGALCGVAVMMLAQ